MKRLDGLPYRPCVGVLLFNARRQVFVGQRIDMVQEAWQMPQGGIDRGEDPRDTALRELEEETGVTPDKVEILAETREWLRYDLPPNLVSRVWRGRYRGQEQKWFAARFLGTDTDIDIDTQHPEFSDWRWSPVDEIATHAVSFKRALYEAVIAEFRPFLSPSPDGGHRA
ncbi:MAG: RNA pyrophosphohydrolase [Rhodospirillales bacterium]|nr:RNA pyrophosphohydrolase [Rhodospirillales bacterium]